MCGGRADFWPEDEDVEDFIAACKGWEVERHPLSNARQRFLRFRRKAKPPQKGSKMKKDDWV